MVKRAWVTSTPAVLGLLLAACANVTTIAPDGQRTVRSRKEFAVYVEQVFRFQNGVGSELIDRYELAEGSAPRESPELSAAEDEMQESCRYLNEVVMMSIDGREPDLGLKTRLLQTIDACDRAAHHAANLMDGSGRVAVTRAAAVP